MRKPNGLLTNIILGLISLQVFLKAKFETKKKFSEMRPEVELISFKRKFAHKLS